MATLNIRNLPDEIHAALRVRAARVGRSMEAEARSILAAACQPESKAGEVQALMDWVEALYGHEKPRHVVDDLIEARRREAAQE